MEPDAADDDYMGDLSHFLPPPTPSSPSRSLGRRRQPPAQQAQGQGKRAKGVVPWQERRRRDRERKQREEDERTMAGLAEAIPETNVGFRLLKRMGYDPAAGCARAPSRWESRSAAPPSAEVAEGERRRVEEMAVELRARQSTQWRNRRVVWDYRKAEAALAQLENREAAPPPPEGEEKAEEEEEEVITEEIYSSAPSLRSSKSATSKQVWICKIYWLSCAMNTTIAFIAVASMNQQKHWQMNVLGQMKMTINSLCLGQQRMVLVTTGDDSLKATRVELESFRKSLQFCIWYALLLHVEGFKGALATALEKSKSRVKKLPTWIILLSPQPAHQRHQQNTTGAESMLQIHAVHVVSLYMNTRPSN
ncbi:hypothetical protein OsJ_27886 [Oryza sativa Japonica Group]|uniref:G-patch domain-containing protein n=1 Tax=Oryza sativa subsp. japonica TaxID=39947 RepID=B9G1Q8_ORYSJ|nr:hypothetical protein OsJ_27886 [Oryza sativa Japonica Group]